MRESTCAPGNTEILVAAASPSPTRVSVAISTVRRGKSISVSVSGESISVSGESISVSISVLVNHIWQINISICCFIIVMHCMIGTFLRVEFRAVQCLVEDLDG